MTDLTIYKKYTFNGNYQREKEDLTYTIFCDYDFSKDKEHTSFFRSDFRGSRFNNVNFYKNNFDRADFISATFYESTFNKVKIAACEMKNCYFESSYFKNNYYNNTSIQECVFKNCTFCDEQFLINMKNCSFIDCHIENCQFERSTTEMINYENCYIFETDFANMHAERYKFISCTLKNILVDACYIYGYLFHNTNIENIKIIYMGDVVDFTEENILYKFAKNLWKESRYYEFINAYIMFSHLENIVGLLKKALTELTANYWPQRKLELFNILEMFQFYITNNVFPYSIVKSIIDYLDVFNLSSLTFDEKVVFLSQFEKIKVYLSDFKYDYNFINSASKHNSFVTFYCNTNDYGYAIKTVKNALDKIYDSLGIEKNYELVDAQKGSWILTFVIITSCALLLPKKYSNLFFEINTKRKISKRISDKLDKKGISSSELEQLSKIAVTSGLITNQENDLKIDDLNKLVDMIKIGL